MFPTGRTFSQERYCMSGAAVTPLLLVTNTLLLLVLCWWSQYDAPLSTPTAVRANSFIPTAA